MDHVINILLADYPQFTFAHGEVAFWSPSDKTVHYTTGKPHSEASILHELAHGLLAHVNYSNDLDLLRKEIDAWELAKNISCRYDITIDANHVQDCLDTYRDWLHKRSTCPRCGMNGLQNGTKVYTCLNCSHEWCVGSARFCRPYRRSTDMKKSRNTVPALFHFS